MKSFVLLLAIVGASIGSSKAEVDCKKPPNFAKVKNCCKIPEPKWSAFTPQCGRYSIPSQRSQSPCFIECIFNSTNSLDGDNLNLDNVRNMLNTLFETQPEFAEAYKASFEKCAPIVSQRIADSKAKKGQNIPKAHTGPVCGFTGTFYSMCAHKNVFTSCPSTAWTPSTDCEYMKEYATSCEAQMAGPVGRRGGSHQKRGRRQAPEDPPVDPSQSDSASSTSPDQQRQPGKRRNRMQGQGRRREQGQGQGQGQGRSQGQGQGQGQVQGQGQGGPRQRQGRGQGQGQGQGQRRMPSQGEGQGQMRGPNRRRNQQQQQQGQDQGQQIAGDAVGSTST